MGGKQCSAETETEAKTRRKKKKEKRKKKKKNSGQAHPLRHARRTSSASPVHSRHQPTLAPDQRDMVGLQYPLGRIAHPASVVIARPSVATRGHCAAH